MDPKTWQQLIILVAALLPGFVFQVCLGWLRGATEFDRPVSSRVFSFAALTIIYDAVYVWLFGSWIQSIGTNRTDVLVFARSLSLALLALVLAIPALTALLWHWLTAVVHKKTIKVSLAEISRGVPVLTSWDYAAKHAFGDEGTRIRIQFKDGRYIGGYAQRAHSHMSLSPGRRDLFIANLRELDEDGYFASEEDSTQKYPYQGHGVWINCEEAISVEFLSGEVVRPVDTPKKIWRTPKWWKRIISNKWSIRASRKK